MNKLSDRAAETLGRVINTYYCQGRPTAHLTNLLTQVYGVDRKTSGLWEMELNGAWLFKRLDEINLHSPLSTPLKATSVYAKSHMPLERPVWPYSEGKVSK